MFGMSGTELVIILVVALLFLGPEELPRVAKLVGRGMKEFQKATDDLRSTVETQFNEMQRPEAEAPPEKPSLGRAPPEGSISAANRAPAALPPAADGTAPAVESPEDGAKVVSLEAYKDAAPRR